MKVPSLIIFFEVPVWVAARYPHVDVCVWRRPEGALLQHAHGLIGERMSSISASEEQAPPAGNVRHEMAPAKAPLVAGTPLSSSSAAPAVHHRDEERASQALGMQCRLRATTSSLRRTRRGSC